MVRHRIVIVPNSLADDAEVAQQQPVELPTDEPLVGGVVKRDVPQFIKNIVKFELLVREAGRVLNVHAIAIAPIEASQPLQPRLGPAADERSVTLRTRLRGASGAERRRLRNAAGGAARASLVKKAAAREGKDLSL